MRPVGVPKKPKKKERQRKKLNSGKLAIRRDHPRRRIETPFGVVGGPRAIKFQLSSKSVHWFPSCGGGKLPIPIALPSGLYNSLYYRTSRDIIIRPHRSTGQ